MISNNFSQKTFQIQVSGGREYQTIPNQKAQFEIKFKRILILLDLKQIKQISCMKTFVFPFSKITHVFIWE